MTPEQYQEAKVLFEEGLSVPVEERGSWLDDRCPDANLREAVRSLLSEHDAPHAFVDGPMDQGIAELISDNVDSVETCAKRALLPKRIGQYKIVKIVGQGGMGTVYEAQQQSPQRRVALKVIRSSMISRQLIRRFKLEAEVLGQLQHPGIAQIYEASIDERSNDSAPFFAMEFIEGQSLTNFCKARELRVDQCLELVARVCDAVQHAHQKGVIHRDLKPVNILVIDDEENASCIERSAHRATTKPMGQPKIVDFGIARMLDSDQRVVTLETNVGELLGTLCYMSPEQVSADTSDIDTQCDVYSLGVVLYEVLAGHVPFSFSGMAITKAVSIVREQDPPRLGSVDQALRGDIETIVCKAMEKQRGRRYATAAELAADIRRYLNSEPIQARPATTFYQLSRFARRNKALVGGATATMLALILGLVGSLYGLQQATQRQKQLQAVADFQGRMLTNIDLEEMGGQLRADLRTDAVRVANEDDEISRVLVEQLLSRIDATGIASRLLDEQVISNAVDTVDREFEDQPLIEAELRMSLGSVYDSLGLYEKARLQFESAHSHRSALVGTDDPSALVAARKASMTLAMLGRYEEAEQELLEVVEGMRLELGSQDPETLRALLQLASIQEDRSKFSEAEENFREALVVARRELNPHDQLLIDAMAMLGNHLRHTNQPEESESLLREVLQISRDAKGYGHPSTIARMKDLALLLTSVRKYEEAEPLISEVHERFQNIYGANHPSTLSSGHNLAENYIYMRKYESAEPLLREALAKRKTVLGEEHPAVLRSLNTLSHLLVRTHRRREAVDVLLESYRIAVRTLGISHNTTSVAALNLASSYKDLGAFKEAEQFAIASIEGRKASFGPDHPRTIVAKDVQGAILLAAGRFEEARLLYSGLMEQVRRTGMTGTRSYSSVLSRLAQAQIASGHADKAEPLCRELLDYCRENMPNNPAAFALAQRLHVTSLIPQHKYASAESLLDEALPELEKRFPPDHWQIQYTKALIAATRYGSGDAGQKRFLAEHAKAVQKLKEQISVNERQMIVSQLDAYLMSDNSPTSLLAPTD